MSSKTLDKLESNITATKDKLIEDLQLVVKNAEELLQATANQTDEAAIVARGRMQDNLHIVKKSLLAAEQSVIEQTRHATKVADEYVHDNPWKAIGISACAGIIVGMLIARPK